MAVPRTVATLSEGDFFGEMALFTGEPRTANVLALEETEVLEIGHAAMKRVFDTNPDLVESLSFIMAERRQGLASQSRLHNHNFRLPLPAFSPQSSGSSASTTSKTFVGRPSVVAPAWECGEGGHGGSPLQKCPD